MNILAIDTTTEACSAALSINGEIREQFEVAPRRHVELILPMVDSLLAEAQLSLGSLDGLAFARGPGAFTGVRICTSVAQGLAFGKDIPVVPVSTLAALATGSGAKQGLVLSAIDARMGEIYWGLYLVDDEGMVQLLADEGVCRAEALEIRVEQPCYGVGTGWGEYEKILSLRLGEHYAGFNEGKLPRASEVLKIATREFRAGNYLDAEEILPVYLRDSVVQQGA